MTSVEINSDVELSEPEIEKILAVSSALNGVRTDLELQLIVDIVVNLYNSGYPWDNIGLSIVGAIKMEGVH